LGVFCWSLTSAGGFVHDNDTLLRVGTKPHPVDISICCGAPLPDNKVPRASLAAGVFARPPYYVTSKQVKFEVPPYYAYTMINNVAKTA
jgi:hypothetical protein